MIALALMLAVPEDVPVVTEAVTSALSQLGTVARGQAEAGATRYYVSIGCGNGWNSYSLQWQRPTDKGPRRWGPPSKAPKPDAPLPDAVMLAAVGDVCDSFEVSLTGDQYFEVDWSLKDGVVSSDVEPVKDLNNASWDYDAQQHTLAFFGGPATAIPRKNSR
ncbi:hypothetical protein [Sphingomonas soli]|uniref:hypothetical protein n=1 Tax=Sphingomonas soli TaxID=266127 RepID=UPI000835EFDB|nr:hypothetical protein [Sphingomonas soli]